MVAILSLWEFEVFGVAKMVTVGHGLQLKMDLSKIWNKKLMSGRDLAIFPQYGFCGLGPFTRMMVPFISSRYNLSDSITNLSGSQMSFLFGTC